MSVEVSAPDDPCQECGICCRAFALPPFDANEHIRAPDALLEEIEAYARSDRYSESSPCLWLDPSSGRCRHHDVRPCLCRWFPAGGQACNDLRAEAGLSPVVSSAAAAP